MDSDLRITSSEYEPDGLPFQVTPIYNQCQAGGTPVNVFQSTSPELRVELQFSGLSGGSSVLLEAQVCDIFGNCEAAPPVVR